jgi:hypothetical protein
VIGLSHKLQGEVDVAFNHRMYRITISLVKKRLPTSRVPFSHPFREL